MRLSVLLSSQLILLAFTATAWSATAVLPTSHKIKLDNRSGEAISTITATPKGIADLSTANVLASSIAAGASGDVTLQANEGDCLFTLAITFASGKTVQRQDTDVCQTETIMVE
jgi:hypothetical protein